MRYPCIQSSCFHIREANELPPLDKLDRTGPHILTDTELLTVFASPKTQANIHSNLLEKTSLRNLMDNLNNSSLDEKTRLRLKSALEIHQRYLDGKTNARPALTNIEESRHYIKTWLCQFTDEVFGCVFLDNRHRSIKNEVICNGKLRTDSIDPRIMTERCLELNAAALIFCRNVTAGEGYINDTDILVAKKLNENLELINVRCLDMLIAGNHHTISMAEKGYM